MKERRAEPLASLKEFLSSFQKMKFSKEKFKKNAPKGIQKQLKGHLDALDGLEVVFDERFGRDGYIPRYFKDGTEYYLYPVYKTWCTEVRS